MQYYNKKIIFKLYFNIYIILNTLNFKLFLNNIIIVFSFEIFYYNNFLDFCYKFLNYYSYKRYKIKNKNQDIIYLVVCCSLYNY